MMEVRGEKEGPKMKGLIQSGPLSLPLFSLIAKREIVGSPAFSFRSQTTGSSLKILNLLPGAKEDSQGGSQQQLVQPSTETFGGPQLRSSHLHANPKEQHACS